MRSAESYLETYRKMCLTRALNDRFLSLKAEGHVDGPIHRSSGQEAIGVALCGLLNQDDYVISNHRGWAHWIGKGLDVRRLCSEILGRASGLCQGKGGEMLVADMSKHLMSTTIVGGGLPLAVGLAMAIKRLPGQQVVVCFFGDGASNTGAFHESLNLAALEKAPVIFVCENNQWALSTHVSQSTAVRDIAMRAVSYNMPGYIVDGNDVFELEEVFNQVMPAVRAGGGPVLLEAKTYRLGTFSSNDRANGYQKGEDIKRWTAKDPIPLLRNQLLHLEIGSVEELDEIAESASRDAMEAVIWAREEAYPELAALYDDVFA